MAEDSKKPKRTRTRKKAPAKTKPNADKPVAQVPVAVVANACPKCHSTARGNIYNTDRRDVPGTFQGQIYDFQIRKWCACEKCGQRRVIVEHHRK